MGGDLGTRFVKAKTMKRVFLAILVMLLASCGGGGGGPSTQQELFRQSPPTTSGEPTLEIIAVKSGNNWRVELFATNSTDLYQAAASISFPEDKYTVLLVSAGGGLGGPQTSLFAGKETSPGLVDFGYTRRFAGSGQSGDLRLASIKVVPLGEFNIQDFSLDTSEGNLVLRDSARNPLVFQLPGGEGWGVESE